MRAYDAQDFHDSAIWCKGENQVHDTLPNMLQCTSLVVQQGARFHVVTQCHANRTVQAVLWICLVSSTFL
jgi:hypothetical protein